MKRPLNKRGIADIEVIATHLLEAACKFNHVVTSPARRAVSTIEHLSRQLPEQDIDWNVEQRLYTFEKSQLLEFVRSLDDSISELTIIGHNPAFTDFCNHVSDGQIKNIPTTGYVQLKSLSDIGWNEVRRDTFALSKFLRPKSFK